MITETAPARNHLRIGINAAGLDGPFGGANRFVQNLETGLRAAGHYTTNRLEPDLDVIFHCFAHEVSRLVSFSASDVAAYKRSFPNTIVIHRINACDEQRGSGVNQNKFVIAANKSADHTVFVSNFMREFWTDNGLNAEGHRLRS